MSTTYCPIPWIFQAVRNNGDIRVCCQANITKNEGIIRKPDGTPYNAGRDDLWEARNAELMREMRLQMLKGEWPEECARCMSEEESGLQSRRGYENEWWSKYDHAWAVENTQQDGTIDFPVRHLDLRFGNLCNLACRMCGPTDSHTWYKDHVALYGPTYRDTHGTVELKQNEKGRWYTNDYDWHHSSSFWEYMEANMDTIDHVYMAGGEPLMIERHYEFLQNCIDYGRSSEMIIEYNTNITNIPERVMEMWTHFKRVHIGASVDGMGEVLEYQRWPAKWSSMLKNIQKIDQLPKNVRAHLSVTVTSLNVFHMPDFMKWKLDQNFQKINTGKMKPLITHHMAHRPYHMNVQVIPDELKQQITQKYQEAKPYFTGKYEKAAERVLDSICNYMNKNSLYEQHWKDFVQRTKKLDQLRGQNILDIVPQYKEYMND